MSSPTFTHLNSDWNADPNAPYEKVSVDGSTVRLSFYLNHWAYEAGEEERATLTFEECCLWRLGGTNDEGWYLGQCRYGDMAPEWGEFYELVGEDDQRLKPTDWQKLTEITPENRHFLFYLRDETFECLAASWKFERGQ